MSKIAKPRTSKGLATLCANAASDKIAQDIIILDLRKIDSRPAEYFVICTCESEPQVQAAADWVERIVRTAGGGSPRSEGFEAKEWVLLDYFDVVVHVMIKSARAHYKLEKLWADSDFYKLEEDGKPKKMKQDEIVQYVMMEEGSEI